MSRREIYRPLPPLPAGMNATFPWSHAIAPPLARSGRRHRTT